MDEPQTSLKNALSAIAKAKRALKNIQASSVKDPFGQVHTNAREAERNLGDAKSAIELACVSWNRFYGMKKPRPRDHLRDEASLRADTQVGALAKVARSPSHATGRRMKNPASEADPRRGLFTLVTMRVPFTERGKYFIPYR